MKSLYEKSVDILWYLLVVVLPITSMPLIVAITGSEYVAPPALVILAVVFCLWFIPAVIRGEKLPRQVFPLLGFISVALIASFIALLLPIPPYRAISPQHAFLEAFVTLGIGAIFFLFTSIFLKDEHRFKLTLRIINWSGLLIILWSGLQMAVYLQMHNYPDWMENFQALFSTSILFSRRVTGFALEPSWLAHQLNMLYLPFWLASVVRRYSAHSYRLWVFQFEDLLLAGGIITLFLSFSRVGLLAFLCTVGYLIFLLNIKLVREAGKNYRMIRLIPTSPKVRRTLISILLVLFYFVCLLGMGWGLSRIDRRMADLFNFSTQESNPILRYADSLKFGERVVYWLSAWDVFNEHPFLGVGLGNAGFYMPETIAPFGRSLVEVRNLIYRSDVLLNAKSLWFRLLAETGIIGFAVFIAWLAGIWRSARYLQKSTLPINKMIGLAGILMVIGFIFEGLSVDSFALPYYWVTSGLIVAASCNLRSGINQDIKEEGYV